MVRGRICPLSELCGREMCDVAEVCTHSLGRKGRRLYRVGMQTVSSWTLPGEWDSGSVTNVRITLDL